MFNNSTVLENAVLSWTLQLYQVTSDKLFPLLDM